MHWFYRYKLYHLPFWLAYHCVWWTVNSGSLTAVASQMAVPAYAIKTGFYIVFQAVAVYFNLYVLMPRLLEKGRYTAYVAAVLVTIGVTAAAIATGYYAGAAWTGTSFVSLFGVDPHQYAHFFQVNTLPSTAASMTLGMSVKLAKNWIQTRRREQVLENEKLETELKFLRAQINPHFLFNSINSIFVLIGKNPEQAAQSLAQFSDLLRYQLYECNDHQIPLDKELTYLENFIGLERLRQEQTVELLFDFPAPLTDSELIAPFLLVPFVENAFKHVSRGADTDNWIHMHLRVEQWRLKFSISNSVTAGRGQHFESPSTSGIGLANAKRRLQLIYPGRHELSIESNADSHSVRLWIDLIPHPTVHEMKRPKTAAL